MTIDCKSPKKAINIINQVSGLLKEQELYVGIYPEGTRSKNGELRDKVRDIIENSLKYNHR